MKHLPFDSVSRPPSRAALEQLEQLADLMDCFWRIPGTNFRIGIDPFLGLIPGVGDLLAFGPHVYLIWHASRAGAPRLLLVRMSFNAVLDAVIGTIPAVGDLFDVAFKANRRNLKLFRRWLDRHEPPPMAGSSR